MKVKELVQLLVQLPPDAEIGVQTSWNWVSEISEIQTIEEALTWEPSLQNLGDCKYTIITRN